MNMLMVLEIIVGIIVLAAVVRFAIRDARLRGSDSLAQHPEPERTPPAPESGSEAEAEEHPSEVADRA
jgi:hypothetical protein